MEDIRRNSDRRIDAEAGICRSPRLELLTPAAVSRMVRVALLLVASVVILCQGGQLLAQMPPNTVYLTANFKQIINGVAGWDQTGKQTTLEWLKAWGGTVDALAMSPTNDEILVWDTDGMHRYDYRTGGQSFLKLLNTQTLNWGCVDEDGGMVWGDDSVPGIYRADDVVGTNTTLLWPDTLPSQRWAVNCVCWNGTTGGYVVGRFDTKNGHVQFVAPDGTLVRTISGIPHITGADWSPWTGDVIVSRYGGPGTPGLVRISPGGAVTSIGSPGPLTEATNAIEVLEQNGANAEQFLIVEVGRCNWHLAIMDSMARPVTTLTSDCIWGSSDCELFGARKLWAMNRWVVGKTGRLNLNMGSRSSGDSYLVALANSHAPSLTIGRFTVHLTPDPLFYLTVSGAATAIFRDFVGKLDANGKPIGPQPSVAIPNVPALRGIRIFGGAISFGAHGVSGATNCWGITIQ